MTADKIASARSFLFVPGDRPERFDKAVAAGADQTIIDLEDAVSPDNKPAARANLRAWLTADRPVVVRINAPVTAAFDEDLALCGAPGVAGIIVAKSETEEDLQRVRAAAPGVSLLPLVESAKGMANAQILAASTDVVRLLFGSIDFQLDLSIPSDGSALDAFRSHLVLASRVAGRAAPVDGVTANLEDADLLRGDIERARSFGFGAKLCIHPRQVAAVNVGFAPTDAEVRWATRVMEAVDAPQNAGNSAIALGGEMIDRPVVLRAEAILRRSAPSS